MQDQDDDHDTEGVETPDSAAKYIASLTDELAKLAKRNGLDTLSYLLEMARLAADQDQDQERDPDSED
jgi:hypothetical protein